jgi:hypothetical protein
MIKKKTIKGQRLYPWQLAVFRLYDEHPKDSIITIKSPRQRAKTHTIINLVMRECINNPKFTAIIVCPTYQLCRKMYKELDNNLSPIPKLIKSANSSYLEFEFCNKSQIKLKSAESRSSLRGDTANLLIIDEGAFVNLDTALECFNYTNTTNGNIVIASTPTFEDDNNLFYKYYKAALDGEENCYLVDFCNFDTTALMPVSRMELYKKTMPFNIYLNEIEGQFLTTKSSLWDFGKVLRNNVLADNDLVCGIDFATGTNNDETSISVFNSKHQMVYLWHFNDKDSTETINFIINVLKTNPIKKCCIETNSLGTVYKDLLKKEIAKNRIRVQLIEMVTTNQSKREYIENMQLEIQNQTCTLLDEHKLKIEFAQFQMKTTSTGLITYGNSSDTYNDDIVISTALALHCFKKGTLNIR